MAAPPAVRPLRGPDAFTALLASTIRARVPGFRAWAEHNPSETTIFLGVGASKRNFPRAVDRNRIKRLVRASATANRQALAGHRIVVLVDRQIRPANGRAVLEALERLWPALLARARDPAPRQTRPHSP
ncbi:MAG: ribonuclease P protein component [Gammaproteobacteria bacterium]